MCHLAARLPDDAARHVVADHHLLRHVRRAHRARQLVADIQSKYNIIFMEKYLFSLTKIFVVICVTSARWRRRP